MRLGERRFREAAPHALRTVVPRAGHLVNLYRPDAINRLLLGIGATTRAAGDGPDPGLVS